MSCVRPGPAGGHEAIAGQAEYRQVPIGLGEDYPEESRKVAIARRDLEVLETNGLHLLRISFPWAEIEPEPGHYEWAFWDELVNLATQQYGVRLIPYVCYTPRWAAANSTEDFWRQPPKDPELFAQFLRRIVTRYQDRIHSWELWNEPDNPDYWRGSVEQFEDLLAAGGKAVREADPKAKVVMGGLAWNLNFLEAMLTNAAAIHNVDVINLHNYYETWSSDPLERIPDYVGRAQDILLSHGQHQPLWMAEAGYSSFRRGARVSNEVRAFYFYEHTPEHEAASLFRAMSLLLASGKVSLVTWYRINDLPGTQEVIGDENNRYLGVLYADGRPKPALRALTYFHSLFDGGFHCIDDRVRMTKQLHSAAEVHAFERPDGSVVVVAWLRTVVPGERGADTTGQAPDTRQERLDLVFPFAMEKTAARSDDLGRQQGTLPVESRHDQSTLTDLCLRDDGVTVLVLQRVEGRYRVTDATPPSSH